MHTCIYLSQWLLALRITKVVQSKMSSSLSKSTSIYFVFEIIDLTQLNCISRFVSEKVCSLKSDLGCRPLISFFGMIHLIMCCCCAEWKGYHLRISSTSSSDFCLTDTRYRFLLFMWYNCYLLNHCWRNTLLITAGLEASRKFMAGDRVIAVFCKNQMCCSKLLSLNPLKTFT